MKKKVAVVSAFPPSKDNFGYPSSLPYQILKHLPNDLDVDLYYFAGLDKNKNIIETDINNLKLSYAFEIPQSNILKQKYIRWRTINSGLPYGVSLFPPNGRVTRRINDSNPCLVWLYPYWLIDWVPNILCKNIVVTGPDASVLHSERAIRFGKWDTYGEIMTEFDQLSRNTELEKKWGCKDVRIHMVGQDDVQKYSLISQRNDQASFIRLPHNCYSPIAKSMDETGGKLKILIAGSAKTVYFGDHLSRISKSLVEASTYLAKYYDFVFIGNGYELIISQLQKSGYEAVKKDWVEDYEKEISEAHIQIFPIAVGTGTKTKVLSALATGLLGIGSRFAFENVLIDPKEDVLIYREPEETVIFLLQVLNNISYYTTIATKTSEKVKTAHNPSSVSIDFWEWAALV